MDEAIPDRYANNPMLVILENYVLDAIGKLEPEKAARLSEIVCRSFGGNDWRAAVRRQFDLPPGSEESLRNLWKQRSEQAEAEQRDYAAEDFAREVADETMEAMGH